MVVAAAKGVVRTDGQPASRPAVSLASAAEERGRGRERGLDGTWKDEGNRDVRMGERASGDGVGRRERE